MRVLEQVDEEEEEGEEGRSEIRMNHVMSRNKVGKVRKHRVR